MGHLVIGIFYRVLAICFLELLAVLGLLLGDGHSHHRSVGRPFEARDAILDQRQRPCLAAVGRDQPYLAIVAPIGEKGDPSAIRRPARTRGAASVSPRQLVWFLTLACQPDLAIESVVLPIGRRHRVQHCASIRRYLRAAGGLKGENLFEVRPTGFDRVGGPSRIRVVGHNRSRSEQPYSNQD